MISFTVLNEAFPSRSYSSSGMAFPITDLNLLSSIIEASRAITYRSSLVMTVAASQVVAFVSCGNTFTICIASIPCFPTNMFQVISFGSLSSAGLTPYWVIRSPLCINRLLFYSTLWNLPVLVETMFRSLTNWSFSTDVNVSHPPLISVRNSKRTDMLCWYEQYICLVVRHFLLRNENNGTSMKKFNLRHTQWVYSLLSFSIMNTFRHPQYLLKIFLFIITTLSQLETKFFEI